MALSVIRASMHRTDRRLSVVLAVVALAGAIVVHHGAPHPMGGMHGDHAMAAAAMCIGTIAGAVAIVGLVATVVRRRRRPRAARSVMPVVARLVPTAPVPRARSSPLYLQHAVLRR